MRNTDLLLSNFSCAVATSVFCVILVCREYENFCRIAATTATTTNRKREELSVFVFVFASKSDVT